MFGEEKRVYMEDLNLKTWNYDETISMLTLDWPGKTNEDSTLKQKITTFDVLKVRVSTKPNKYPMDVRIDLLHPTEVESQ